MKQYYLVLFLLLFLSGLQAQVRVIYEKHLTGKVNISDVAAIMVSSFVEVDIDYIYKGWITDADGKEVLRLRSEVLTQPRGVINYNQNDAFDSWKKGSLNYEIDYQSIDFASYSGRLIFHSSLVHPLDTTSVIARKTKGVYVKNGRYVSAMGAPTIDPRLVNFNFTLGHNSKFSLDSLFTNLYFNNKNDVNACLPLFLQITQAGEKIYTAKMDQFCIPPGEHQMSEMQVRALTVEVNEYDQKDNTQAIKVGYRLGESAGSRAISKVAHADLDFSFRSYTYHASGLQFDFLNQATVHSNLPASSSVVTFDAEGVVDLDFLDWSDRGENPLGLYHPYGFTLGREDFNGHIALTTLNRSNFSPEQWKAFVAYINKVEPTFLRIFEHEGIQVIAPDKLENIDKQSEAKRALKGFAFLILDQERAIIYHAYYFSFPPDSPFPNNRESLNLGQAVSSIEYNGVQLGFNFEKGILKNLVFQGELLPQAERKERFDRMRRYHYLVNGTEEEGSGVRRQEKVSLEKLDQIIAEKKISEVSDIPTYVLSTPEGISHLKYETLSWDSVGIQLSYRADKAGRQQIHNRVEQYDYREQYKIESSGYRASAVNFSYQTGNITEDKQVIPLFAHHLELRSNAQMIELSRLKGVPKDVEWIKALVRFHNLSRRNDPVQCKVLESKGWTFYLPNNKTPKTRWQKESICFIVDSGKEIYRIKIVVPSAFDKNFVLNSLVIEGKGLQVSFDGEEVEAIKIR